MNAEYQTPIEFEDIKKDDVVVMEVFSDDNNRYIGEWRGKALHTISTTSIEKVTVTWYFDGMSPLYSDSTLNYRLFRVEPPSELEKLRELEKKVKDTLKQRRAERSQMIDKAILFHRVGMYGAANQMMDTVEKLSTEIKVLTALGVK